MSIKILAFGASNSRNSINKKLAAYASGLFKDAKVNLVDLNDFDLPIFSIDRENPIPQKAIDFAELIDEADLLLISLAEHNGSYTSAFKNLFDWISRIPNRQAFNGKPMFLLSTSTGGRGGASVLEAAVKRFPFNGGVVLASMSLPFFEKNFKDGDGITDPELLQKLKNLVYETEINLKVS